MLKLTKPYIQFCKFVRVGATLEDYSVSPCLLISALPEMDKYLFFPNAASKSISLKLETLWRVSDPSSQMARLTMGPPKPWFSHSTSKNIFQLIVNVRYPFDILVLNVKFPELKFPSLTKDKLSVQKLKQESSNWNNEMQYYLFCSHCLIKHFEMERMVRRISYEESDNNLFRLLQRIPT